MHVQYYYMGVTFSQLECMIPEGMIVFKMAMCLVHVNQTQPQLANKSKQNIFDVQAQLTW